MDNSQLAANHLNGNDVTKSETEEKIDTIKKEIDALQIEVMQSKKPRKWYKEASTIISMFALIFSLLTSSASYFQVDSQNKRAARGELRGLIQRLIALPKEHAELQKIYKNNPAVFSSLSSSISQESALLSSQAVELANRIPNDISAPEYASIAQSLIDQGITNQRISTLLEAGLKVTKDIDSELALLRIYGRYLFITGNINGGRQKYEEAMNVFSKHSVTDPVFTEISNFDTEMNWARSEYTKGECKQAEKLLQSASSRITKLPQDERAEYLQGQVKVAQDGMKKNCKSCKL